MDQAEYLDNNELAPQYDHRHDDVPEPQTLTEAEQEYPAIAYTWTAFLIGAAVLTIAGIVGGILALLLFNYTSGGFS